MFIDITENTNIKPKIKSKELLENELFKIKEKLAKNDFETLIKILNLEISSSKCYKLFEKSKNFPVLIDIFLFNLYYMSLNFIKDFFESRNLNFECKFSPFYGEIHLKFKDVRLFGTCYAKSLLATISYFSCDKETLLEKCTKIINCLKNNVNDNFDLKVTSDEYIKSKRLKTAKQLKNILTILSNEDINIINDFYSDYVEHLEIDFSSEEREIFFICAVDLCNLEIL